MENSLENFRQTLINQNEDIKAPTTLEEEVEVAFKALDKLTDTLVERMNGTACAGCVRNYGVMLGGALSAFNTIADLRNELEESGGPTC